MAYVVATWYTPQYKDMYRRLAESIRNFGLLGVGYEAADQGSWFNNVLYHKPRCLCEAMAEFPLHDVVYTDSDSVFRRQPVLFDHWDMRYDIGVHYLYGHELLGGTQYWRNTPKVRTLVEEMRDTMHRERVSSQVALSRILKGRPDINVYRLPPEYCFIFDTSRHIYPGVEPVVEHFQASRQMRNAEYTVTAS